MGWKPITLALFSEFQRCLQDKGIPESSFNEISECFQATFNEGALPPDPPDPPPSGGFAACGGNQSKRGVGAEMGKWCTDEAFNFPEVDAETFGMESNAEAVRSRLPNHPGRGIAPTTVGSNRVIMECEMKFRQDWLDGINLGGQHLFKLGEGPWIMSNGQESPDHIRFDFGAFDVGGGNGFRDGFRVLVYAKRAGHHAETWFPSTTKMPNVFVADAWTPVKADGRYDPNTGRCTLTLVIGNQTRTAEVTVASGIPVKLGDSIGLGNVDSRPGQVLFRKLRYRTS